MLWAATDHVISELATGNENAPHIECKCVTRTKSAVYLQKIIAGQPNSNWSWNRQVKRQVRQIKWWLESLCQRNKSKQSGVMLGWLGKGLGYRLRCQVQFPPFHVCYLLPSPTHDLHKLSWWAKYTPLCWPCQFMSRYKNVLWNICYTQRLASAEKPVCIAL